MSDEKHGISKEEFIDILDDLNPHDKITDFQIEGRRYSAEHGKYIATFRKEMKSDTD